MSINTNRILFIHRLSIAILLNVVRHESLAVKVAVDFDGADVIVDLMQLFRDKGTIFNSSCELLCCMVDLSGVVKVQKFISDHNS